MEKFRVVSAKDVESQIASNPKWLAQQREPIHVQGFCKLPTVEDIPKETVFLGDPASGKAADLSNAPLPIAQGTFHGTVNFSESDIREIGELNVQTERSGICVAFTGCKNLKIAKGKFPRPADFSRSGVEKIEGLTIEKPGKTGVYAIFNDTPVEKNNPIQVGIESLQPPNKDIPPSTDWPQIKIVEREVLYELEADFSVETGIKPDQDIHTEQISLSKDGRLTLRQGFQWDGTTSAPDVPAMERSALVHDGFYALMRTGLLDHKKYRQDADKLLAQHSIEDGLNPTAAILAYALTNAMGGKYADPVIARQKELAEERKQTAARVALLKGPTNVENPVVEIQNQLGSNTNEPPTAGLQNAQRLQQEPPTSGFLDSMRKRLAGITQEISLRAQPAEMR